MATFLVLLIIFGFIILIASFSGDNQKTNQAIQNKEIDRSKILKIVEEKNLKDCRSFPNIFTDNYSAAEYLTKKYVNDNSALFKREFWSLREFGVVLVIFGAPTKVMFVKGDSLGVVLDGNVAYEVSNFLNTVGPSGRGLIVVGRCVKGMMYDWSLCTGQNSRNPHWVRL